MKKFIMIVLSCSLLTLGACAKKSDHHTMKSDAMKNNIYCVEGVKYLYREGAITVMYNPDGSIKSCE